MYFIFSDSGVCDIQLQQIGYLEEKHKKFGDNWYSDSTAWLRMPESDI